MVMFETVDILMNLFSFRFMNKQADHFAKINDSLNPLINIIFGASTKMIAIVVEVI